MTSCKIVTGLLTYSKELYVQTMGGQCHGPNLGMMPRIGFRRSEDQTEEKLSRYQSKLNQVSVLKFAIECSNQLLLTIQERYQRETYCFMRDKKIFLNQLKFQAYVP